MGIVYLGYNGGNPVTSGSVIPMTTVIRKKCTNINTNLTLKGPGYYLITVNATLSSTAGGTATLTLNQNSQPVATASGTIAANGSQAISFSAVVRNDCCHPSSNLTLVYNGAVLTATYASIIIQDA